MNGSGGRCFAPASTKFQDKYSSTAQDPKRGGEVRAIVKQVNKARVAEALNAPVGNAASGDRDKRMVTGYQYIHTSLPELLVHKTLTDAFNTVQMKRACELVEAHIVHAMHNNKRATLARGCFTLDDLRAKIDQVGCTVFALEDDSAFCRGHLKAIIYFHSTEQSEVHAGRYTLVQFSAAIKKIIDNRNGAGRVVPTEEEMCEFRVRASLQLEVYLEPAYTALAPCPLPETSPIAVGSNRFYCMSGAELCETPETSILK